MKTLSFLFVSFLAFSCATKKNASTTGNNADSSSETKELMITANIGENAGKSDPFTISAVSVQGNIMTLDVSYSGGCAEHVFQVIGSASIAKSMPAIRSVQLVHKSNGDACKKMIMQKIKVDIKALAYKQTSGSEIYLSLQGWKDRIKYTFE